MSRKILKLASYLYFSYAGLALVMLGYGYFWLDESALSSFYAAFSVDSGFYLSRLVIGYSILVIAFGAVIYNQAKYNRRMIYSPVFCVVSTVCVGLFTQPLIFLCLAVPCALVVIDYVVTSRVPESFV